MIVTDNHKVKLSLTFQRKYDQNLESIHQNEFRVYEHVNENIV